MQAPGLSTPALEAAPPSGLDIQRIRADFPILSRRARHGRPLVYLDNAATSQKPRQVIDAISRFYGEENANIHRGLHYLSEQATASYEAARARVASFLGAGAPWEIVFTKGTTEAINLVAQSWARPRLRPGDEVLTTGMEHHANLVPWQVVCEQTGATLRFVPVTDRGELDLEGLDRLLTERTKLLAVGHVSNALGTIHPVRDLVSRAHAVGAVVLVDGAQSAPHLPVDVAELDCDFFACSGHKMLGPTGIGVLYGRAAILDGMPPWQTGGDMIERVTLERTTWAAPPARFEAGTPPIAQAMGLAAAIDYVEGVGRPAIHAWEDQLLGEATARIGALPSVRLVGTAAHKVSVLSFLVEGVHPHDVGAVLDDEGVAVRAGHHCAQPLMQRLGIPATVRASFAFYNTADEIDVLVSGVERALKVFG